MCRYNTTAIDLQGAKAVNFLVNRFCWTFLLVSEELINHDKTVGGLLAVAVDRPNPKEPAKRYKVM